MSWSNILSMKPNEINNSLQWFYYNNPKYNSSLLVISKPSLNQRRKALKQEITEHHRMIEQLTFNQIKNVRCLR